MTREESERWKREAGEFEDFAGTDCHVYMRPVNDGSGEWEAIWAHWGTVSGPARWPSREAVVEQFSPRKFTGRMIV